MRADEGSGVRVSREKINVLARRVTDALLELQEQNRLEFVEDPNSTRLEVRRLLEELLAAEARIDTSARQKIDLGTSYSFSSGRRVDERNATTFAPRSASRRGPAPPP